MPKTRVIALDIYGTVLDEDDFENVMPPRLGFAKFIQQINELGIKLLSSSDANLENLKRNLITAFRNRVPFGLEIFDRFYCLPMCPKDYSDIIVDYAIDPEELLVIGNTYYKDLSGAPSFASKILVPTYNSVSDNFDLSKLNIP